MAAGHLHDLAVAQNAVTQYDRMLELTERGPAPRIAKFMTTRKDEANAWLYALQGRGDDAVVLLRRLADRQDVEGKGEIETPAREMLADMLLELSRPAQALVEYEKSLKIDPNRFNGLYGAGRAAELIGNHEDARVHFVQLLKTCSAARSRRPELLHAHEVAGE